MQGLTDGQIKYQEIKVYLKNIKELNIDRAEECLAYLFNNSD